MLMSQTWITTREVKLYKEGKTYTAEKLSQLHYGNNKGDIDILVIRKKT